MPPYSRRRLAAKKRMQKLRLRYPNGLWNPPVDLPVKETVEEEEPIGFAPVEFEETESDQVQTQDELLTGPLEKNLEETQDVQVPEELLEETIEEIQIVQVGEIFEETPSAIIEIETVETEIEVPEISIFSEELDILCSQ